MLLASLRPALFRDLKLREIIEKDTNTNMSDTNTNIYDTNKNMSYRAGGNEVNQALT